MAEQSRQIMTADAVRKCLVRLASEIIDDCSDGPVALVGIRKGGVPIAQRLADRIEQEEGARPEVGAIDITLYRDDLYTGLESPTFGATDLPFDLDGTGIVLVDDVLFTGRTTRAAMGVIHDYGRPRWIKLAVLVDRGHRELPIQADFVGRTLESNRSDRVTVQAGTQPEPDDAVLLELGDGS